MLWKAIHQLHIIIKNKSEGYMDLSIAKAIVVKGAGNRGKTSLIFELIKNILNDGGEIVLPNHYTISSIINKNKPSDYCMIIKYKGKNVLIMSKGDKEGELKRQIASFIKINITIDVVIGAARTRGQTVWWWQDNFPQRLSFFDNNQKLKEKERVEYIKKQLHSLKAIFIKYL